MALAPQFQKYISSDYKHLDPDSGVVEVPEPPLDNSHTTRMELEQLERVIQEAKLPREIMRVADKDPLRLFYSVAKKKGLDPLEQEAEEWADDWTKLSFEYKLKFKRRRPWEVKKEHDIDFVVNKSDTTESPSYPSGHAMMGYGVAEFYKDKYPLMAEEWDNIADIIAHSRLQMGAHYPSDVEASKKIVEQLAEQVKEASYARQILRTGTLRLTNRAPTGPARRVVRRAPRAGQAPTPTPTPTWGQRASGMGSSIGNWATNNPTQATAAVVGTGAAGAFGANKMMQPKPANQMPKFGSLGHLEQRRSERAKFMSKEDLASLEKRVRVAKDLPEGSHYITLPHGRKGVVRTEGGKSHLATILDARMRPPGRDLTRLLSELNKEANLLSRAGRIIQQGIKQEAGYLAETGRQFAKGVGNIAQSGANAARSGAKGVRHGYEKVITHPKAIPFSLGVQSIVTPNTADDIGNILKLGRYKTAAEKLRLYHGSPHDLETLEPRQPNKGAWGDYGLYGTTNPLAAALYAIARNESPGAWGVLPDGRLIAKSKKEFNPEGYVYEYDSEDYIPPPDDDPGIGYASQSSPEILSKEKVYLDKLRDSITRVDDRDKFLEYFKKTSSDQPLLRHRSTLLIRDPETGKLLAAKEPANSEASPFYFPGGGLYDDEYDTPRNPTEEEIIEGARREALEELGIQLENPRVVGSHAQELEDWWKAKTLKNRGVPYLGGHEHYVLADRGKEDRSLYNVEGDAFEQGDYYDPKEIVEALSRAAKSDSTFAPFNREQVRAIKDNLLKKNASDLSVLTAVPTHNLDLIMRKGLYSQKAMLDDPEVLSAFLAQRNADKAWSNDEQYDEKRFREEYDKRIELMKGNDAPLAGPSVFFTEPDPDKVSDPRHFINKFDTQKLRVNLSKLLADIPETRITGAELIPSSAAKNMSDEEFQQYVKDRRRDITPEEVANYIATDPKELWKHYKDEYLGRYYAADVPHAFIRTPSGIIPPEYLERVEKTSSAKEQLRRILVKQASLEAEFKPDLSPDDLRALGVYDQVYGDAPSEASMKEWPAHWINPQDPLGWLQWYDRYSGGRRTDDDERQIKRWKSFKARHLAQYLSKPTPRRAAALRNWGIDVGKY